MTTPREHARDNPDHWITESLGEPTVCDRGDYRDPVLDLTKEQFVAAYAQRSGMTVERLRELNQEVRPCDCGDEQCQGWQLVTSLDPERLAAVTLEQMRAVAQSIEIVYDPADLTSWPMVAKELTHEDLEPWLLVRPADANEVDWRTAADRRNEAMECGHDFS